MSPGFRGSSVREHPVISHANKKHIRKKSMSWERGMLFVFIGATFSSARIH